jgi:hypothetical protein
LLTLVPGPDPAGGCAATCSVAAPFAAEPTPLSISTIVAHVVESFHPMKAGVMEELLDEITL